MKPACRNCNELPAEGTIFQLCDPCLSAFEAKVSAHVQKTGLPYSLTDREFEFINEPYAKRSQN